MKLQDHINYEVAMMKAANERLSFGHGIDHFLKNALHECWAIHAYNLLTLMDVDYNEMKRKVTEQILSITDKRSPEDSEDRILTPDNECTNFILEEYSKWLERTVN